MLMGKAYDNKVDIWALGVLLYEMVQGDSPYGEEMPVAEKIEHIKNNKEFSFSSELSEEIVDLIKLILKPVPEERFTLADIFVHPWMKNFELKYGL
jgi:aurora kinase